MEIRVCSGNALGVAEVAVVPKPSPCGDTKSPLPHTYTPVYTFSHRRWGSWYCYCISDKVMLLSVAVISATGLEMNMLILHFS